MPSSAEFFEKLATLVTRLGAVHWWSVAVSVFSLAILIPGRRHWPRVPWALIVLVAATAVSLALHLSGKGSGVGQRA